MQVCTSLQTDNHASTPPFSFLQAGCPSCRPTNSIKALKAYVVISELNFWFLVRLLLGCMDFPVETVVSLEGSASSGCGTPAASAASAGASVGTAAAPTVSSEAALPSLPPAVSDAVSSPAPAAQSPPSLQPRAPSSPCERPTDAEESPTQASAEAEAPQDASRRDATLSSSPANDETSEPMLTEAETSSQPPRAAVDDSAASGLS